MCAHRYLRLESKGVRFSLTLEVPLSSSTLTPLWLQGCLDPVKYPGIIYHSVHISYFWISRAVCCIGVMLKKTTIGQCGFLFNLETALRRNVFAENQMPTYIWRPERCDLIIEARFNWTTPLAREPDYNNHEYFSKK